MSIGYGVSSWLSLVLVIYSTTFTTLSSHLGMERSISDVDYSVSTEENFASKDCVPFIGKYDFLRKLLDHDYHNYYSEERQQLHDYLIDQSGDTVIYDKKKNKVCEKPAEGNWIVFTAGAFGAGKSHVLSWLSQRGLFPLESFIVVDPDHIREKLPETAEYIRRNPSTAGMMTQKEVGYIAEVMVLRFLLEGKNVIVDGSLKDSEWYGQYMLRLRNTFSRLKLAIFHVITTLDMAMSRAARRGAETGRVVPMEAITSQIESIPLSIKMLRHYVDFICTFQNDHTPRLVYTSNGDVSLSSFRDVWQMSCRDGDEDMDSCPENLDSWKQNDHPRLFLHAADICKLNSAL